MIFWFILLYSSGENTNSSPIYLLRLIFSPLPTFRVAVVQECWTDSIEKELLCLVVVVSVFLFFHGFSQICHGFSWICIDLHGFFIDFSKILWIFKYFLRLSQIFIILSKMFYRFSEMFQWSFMDFRCFSWIFIKRDLLNKYH